MAEARYGFMVLFDRVAGVSELEHGGDNDDDEMNLSRVTEAFHVEQRRANPPPVWIRINVLILERAHVPECPGPERAEQDSETRGKPGEEQGVPLQGVDAGIDA